MNHADDQDYGIRVGVQWVYPDTDAECHLLMILEVVYSFGVVIIQ